MKKVSIIIPIYNVEQYIEECIKTILAQTYSDIEVLLIDDCSPDNSIAICQRLISENSNAKISLRILHQPKNRGLSAARNLGIENATGDYIIFVDSDDYISPTAIEVLMQEAEKSGADMVIADNIIFRDSKNEAITPNEKKSQYISSVKVNDLISKECISVTAWNKLIKRNFLIDNNLFFETGLIYEDELWSSNIFCCNPTISLISDKTYFYRIRANSLLQSFTQKHFLSRLILFNKTLELIKQIKASKSKRQIYKYLRRKIEGYRIGILMSTVRIDRSAKLFELIYPLLKNRVNHAICIQSDIPLNTRIKALDLIMPPGLDRLYCKIIINRTIKNWPYITGSQPVDIQVDKDFINSISELLISNP